MHASTPKSCSGLANIQPTRAEILCRESASSRGAISAPSEGLLDCYQLHKYLFCTWQVSIRSVTSESSPQLAPRMYASCCGSAE